MVVFNVRDAGDGASAAAAARQGSLTLADGFTGVARPQAPSRRERMAVACPCRWRARTAPQLESGPVRL